MAVMGTDSTIIDDHRDQIAALKAQIERLASQCAEKDRVNAELAAHALKVVRAIKGARASRSGIANLKKRFKEHAAGYLRFLGERIAPTNNVAERALRHCVIDRKVTQGTRGETGERWCECVWTVVSACRKQGRSAFEFFREALRAYTNDAPAPSLLKNP